MDEEQMQRGQQWLTELLELMGMRATVNITKVEQEGETTCCWLTIDQSNLTPEQVAILIGNQGENIDAIQYLANTLLHRQQETTESGYFMIDIQNYRAQRHKELQALAETVAQEVRETGKEVEMKALSSVERRQIHTILSKSTDLTTESRGNEPNRRLIVKPR